MVQCWIHLQDADDDFWNSSHEAHTTSATDVTLANHSSGGINKLFS